MTTHTKYKHTQIKRQKCYGIKLTHQLQTCSKQPTDFILLFVLHYLMEVEVSAP